jgi:polyisoprenoid-binding protein YceI
MEPPWSDVTGFSIAALASGIVGLTAIAYGALSPATDAHVTFHALGPAGTKIDGTTSELAAVDNGASVVVSVTLTNLTTGIKLCDDHMKDKHLEVGKFKTTELKLDRSALNLKPGGGKQQVAGSLILHGSEPKPVTVQYTVAEEKKDDKPGFRISRSRALRRQVVRDHEAPARHADRLHGNDGVLRTPDGEMVLVNECHMNTLTGPLRSRSATAKVADRSVPGRLSVDFGGFFGDYWVIDVDHDYEFAVVSHPTRDYLWILSRKPTLDRVTLEGILDRARSKRPGRH